MPDLQLGHNRRPETAAGPKRAKRGRKSEQNLLVGNPIRHRRQLWARRRVGAPFHRARRQADATLVTACRRCDRWTRSGFAARHSGQQSRCGVHRSDLAGWFRAAEARRRMAHKLKPGQGRSGLGDRSRLPNQTFPRYPSVM